MSAGRAMAAAVSAAALLCGPSAVSAAEPGRGGALSAPIEQLRGEDWLRFSREQKERLIQVGIGGLEQQGVFITKPFSFYVQTVDRMLASEKSFQGQYLDNLFVFCVYDNEPQTRAAIDKIRRENRN